MLGYTVLIITSAVFIVILAFAYRKQIYWLNCEIGFYKGKRDEFESENVLLRQRLLTTTIELSKIKEEKMEEK